MTWRRRADRPAASRRAVGVGSAASRRADRGGFGRDRGSATAELAVSLPALVVMVLVGLTAVTAARLRIECVDAAREAVRAAARGDDGVTAGLRVAPAGAQVSVTAADNQATATVRVRVVPLGGVLPGFEISTTAVAVLEPGVSDGWTDGH
jgi:hypothetical protein